MGLVEQLGQRQEVVEAVAVRILPRLTLLVAANRRHAVPGALLAVFFQIVTVRAPLLNFWAGLFAMSVSFRRVEQLGIDDKKTPFRGIRQA